MKLDIVISGVGGQGSILASRALACSAMKCGLSVRTSEVIGMAQREGPVTSHVRMGSSLHGAIIPQGEAGILLGFELAETVRGLGMLRPGGTVITSLSTIVPVSVQLGISGYDARSFVKYIKERVEKVFFIDADLLAGRAGHPKTANVVMLGALSALHGLPFGPDRLVRAVLDHVPEKLKEINQRAFEIGRLAMEVA